MIYLVRHGETDANRNRYAGREDVPLNHKGKKQAAALVQQFDGVSIDHILCSPLKRAVDTATPLAQHNTIEPRRLPQLNELDFGLLQGQSKSRQRLVIRREYLYESIPGGESLHDLWQRLSVVCTALERLNPSVANVLVVGHYWTNRLLYGRLMNSTFEEAASSRIYRPQTGSAVALHLNSRDKEPENTGL